MKKAFLLSREMGWTGLLLASSTALSADVDESKLPKPAAVTIDYNRDIRPIFEASCFRCHGPERPKSKFRLDNPEAALKGGENGIDIIPGQSAKSPLIHYVARISDEIEMPPKGKGDPLTTEQVALLRAWIDQGARWPEGAGALTNKIFFTFTPSIQFVTVSGDERKFREHYWMREGWSGGAQNFRLENSYKDGTKVTMDGRALANQNDYQVKMSIAKPDLGFTRFGYEQYRKYYDDTGGFHPDDAASPYTLNQDLHVDMGRAWFDAGLTLPDWPKMTVGYEYQFKRGTKSDLAWSAAAGPSVYPATKDIDEKTHIVKFDLEHEIKGVRLDDSFRGEFYDLKTTRTTFGTRDMDSGSHFQGANAFRLEKQLRDWLFLSGGYLFSRLDGEAGFNQEFFVPPDPTVTGIGDVATGILLDRTAHVFNANAMLGPWEGLSFFSGLQTEWNRQRGLGWASYGGAAPAPFETDLSRFIVEENFGLRYTSIPFTVLYADTRFQQESIGRMEVQARPGEDANDNFNDIDSGSHLEEYRAGATISPWTKASFDIALKHRVKHNEYDPLTAFDITEGYPGFIRSRDLKNDALEAKIVLKPAAWLKTTLKYQLDRTDYYTTTAAYMDAGGTPAPGGEIFAGNYDAHTWSINNTLTPWRRLFLSSTLSYSISRLVSGVSNDTSVVPYEGGIYSAITSASFVLNDKTDLRASYTFSKADYGQNNYVGGFPLGIVYERHAVIAGISRQIKKFVSAGLQYGFFSYREPTVNGVNDYTAHAVIGTVTMTFQ